MQRKISSKLNYIDFLEGEAEKEYFKDIIKQVKNWDADSFFPEKDKIFAAFRYHNLWELKVVIVGQDPYKDAAAEGLAFSCFKQRMRASLNNIFKVLRDSHPNLKLKDTSLINWSKQGVLLLNTALTTPREQTENHHQLWDNFTINLFRFLNDNLKGIIYLFLGSQAKVFSRYLDRESNHLIFLSHPSPLSAHISFLGSRIFEQIDRLLAVDGKKIDWET